jgi:hypothetical protein
MSSDSILSNSALDSTPLSVEAVRSLDKFFEGIFNPGDYAGTTCVS